MKEKRRLRRIKVGCKILDRRNTHGTHTEHTQRTHTRTVVLDDLIISIIETLILKHLLTSLGTSIALTILFPKKFGKYLD